jgi:phage repressor protein C with HTH and peptisase S24 domain
MNSLSQRLYECISTLCTLNKVQSFRQFAQSIDYLPETLSDLLESNLEISHDVIRRTCKLYEINLNYIQTGKGDMFATPAGKQDLRILTVVTDVHNEERIVHVPVPAQAGYVSELADPVFYSELPTYSLPDFRFSQGTHRSFDVSGDSMEPVMEDGDIVVCSYIEPNQWMHGIKDDHVYVIVTSTDIVVKRIKNLIKSRQCLQLISDNESYRPYMIPVENIREVWFVRMKISPFSHARPFNPLEDILNSQEKTITEQQEMIRFLKQTIEKFNLVS